MVAVYGFVPIKAPLFAPTCTGLDLKATADKLGQDFNALQTTYCELQYNYLDTINVDQAHVFNPYVKLIHQSLNSSAYAFSIDDKQAFKQVQDTGMIFTIAGTNGLTNKMGTSIPQNKNQISLNCNTNAPHAPTTP
jgi:hypothetical protein